MGISQLQSACESVGVPIPGVLARDVSQLDRVQIIIDLTHILQQIDTLSGHSDLAVQIGVKCTAMPTHMIFFVISASENLRQAFERLVEFWPLLEAEHGMLRVDQDQATLTFDLATASNLVQVHASIQMVQFVALIRQAIGKDIVPERVTFRQISSTARRHACEDFFGTSIAVDADSSLQFSAEDMTRPFNRFDRHIWHGIEQELRTRLSAMTDKMQFSDHVVRAIEAGLPYGQATLAAVAVKLAIGQRSLQRRLREEGVSFASLRDKTRLQLARQYLKTSPQSKTQIAYRLGFRDPNSFFRRYRQWVRDGKLKSD